VDGYNIIFAWEDLSELAKTNIDAARDKLMDIMCNYQGYKKNHLILVFDAYKVAGGRGEVFRYHNIHVVYTKEAETADQYIEKTVHTIGHKYHVTVATSDALEQIIIMGGGADRLSARDLYTEVRQMQQELRETYMAQPAKGSRNYLFDHVDEDLGHLLEEVRLGRRSLDPSDPGEEISDGTESLMKKRNL
jgi:predicted RNA-binding protein with PIN domain